METMDKKPGLLAAFWIFLGALALLTPAANAQNKLEPYYNLLRPEGSGPFPALMLVPGSPGVVGNRPRQAGELKDLGSVASDRF